MAYSTTDLYPEDLNGTNPANLITNEPQTLQVPGPEDFYFIIPKAAPFFVDSLVVLNAATMQPYVEGDDYQIGHLFIEAMDSTGRPIAGSIRFMRPTITGQVLLTYRTLGGPWGFSDTAIMRELSNKLVNPLIRSWGDIDTLPYSFPPLPHDQRIDTLIGSKEINDTLNKIAEILEATAEGTSIAHLEDFNNPHRVNKEQVGLGRVPNFAMATDVEHEEGERNDLFTNPRGVLLMIQTFALAALDSHKEDYANPHRVNKEQVGLGNVPNWSGATAGQAIDPTIDNVFMTPYTTALLIQRLTNDPRLDQLIIDFDNHITANNPHDITPAKIGTYDTQQIDDMIAGISQGGNATTFDGQDASEWEAKFPSVDDINSILDELYGVYAKALADVSQLDVDDPITPEDINLKDAQRISWTFADYGAYSLYNSIGDGVIVASSEIGNGFPTEVIVELNNRWGTTETGSYYVEANNGIKFWGTDPVVVPTIYRNTSSPIESNQISTIYPSKDWVILHLMNDRLLLIDRSMGAGGNAIELIPSVSISNLYVSNGIIDSRVMAVYEDNDDATWHPVGDSSWVTAAQDAIDNATASGMEIVDMRIGTNHIVVIAMGETESRMYVFKINYDSNITLTDVSSVTMVRNHTTGVILPADQITGVTQVAGSFDHNVLTKPIVPDSDLCDLLSFGDDSNGQLEIPASSAPFYSIAAGNGFTVTINQYHFAELWGDSPDNSLIYNGPSRITP